MCRNGQYTERGIKQIDGFMSERWRIEPGYFTKVDPSLGLLGVLLEPTTVVAKAWELVAAMRARAFWEPRQVLVTGAGPIGMLAALIGVQHGLDVHVLDRVTEGAKPQLVHDLGATYHSGAIADIGFDPDVVIECTGVGSVIIDSIRHVGAGGVVCLTGVGSGGPPSGLSPADVAKELVLQNNVVIGSVNANRRHFYRAAEGARRRRPGLARAADLAPGAAPEHRRCAQARPRRHQGRRGLRRLMMATREHEQDGDAVACSTEQTQLGEGIRWDARRDEMLAVDILAGRVARGRVRDDGSLERVRVYQLPWTVGMIAPVEGDDGWLLGAGRGFVYLAPDGTQRTIAEVSPAGTRMNDGACDPQGRFWGGTLADDHHEGGGALYRLDRTGRTELMLDGLTISNGIGWSPDGRTMYLVDSGPRVIHAFAFDGDRGTISDGRILVTVPEDVGAPDGMTVDAAGDLWVAIYGGGRVNRYAPDGSLRKAYPIPARECTCCAFGGPGLNRLFVTTATEGWTDEQRRADPAAGLVYRLRHRCHRPAGRAVSPRPRLVAGPDPVTVSRART